MAAIVFGERAPTGRLPVTIYDEGFIRSRPTKSGSNITDMGLRSELGLTYMHYRGTPVCMLCQDFCMYVFHTVCIHSLSRALTLAALVVVLNVAAPKLFNCPRAYSMPKVVAFWLRFGVRTISYS